MKYGNSGRCAWTVEVSSVNSRRILIYISLVNWSLHSQRCYPPPLLYTPPPLPLWDIYHFPFCRSECQKWREKDRPTGKTYRVNHPSYTAVLSVYNHYVFEPSAKTQVFIFKLVANTFSKKDYIDLFLASSLYSLCFGNHSIQRKYK